MPQRNLPGTVVARLQDGLLLASVLIYRGVAIAGLRSLDYAFTRHTPRGPRQLREPFRSFVRFGFWMLDGITTGNWKSARQ